MIISLVSAAMGIVGGLVTDIFKEIRDSREHGRELERMERTAALQLQLADKQGESRLQEIHGELATEELRAVGQQMAHIYKAQAPTGIRWVDGFNAMIRPATAAALMLLFVFIAGAYAWSLIGAVDLAIPEDWGRLATALWGSMVGEAIQAVLGYLFGYRTTAGRVSQIKAAVAVR